MPPPAPIFGKPGTPRSWQTTPGPSCGLTKWASVAAKLSWHACAEPRPLESAATLDEHLAWLNSRLSRDQRYKVGKLTRTAMIQLLGAVVAEAPRARGGLSAHELLNCTLTNAYGQSRDDLFLLPLLLHVQRASESPGRRRTFVELGALDGMSMSNTYMLERCWGWSGLLIEANPHNAAGLAASPRSATKRHAAVCAGDGTHGEVVRMTGAHNMASMAQFSSAHSKANTVEVPCRALSVLMDEANLHRGASFLSLDVEGAESLVLDTVNTSRFSVVYTEVAPMKTDMASEIGAKNRRVDAQLRAGGLHPLGPLFGNVVYARDPAWSTYAEAWKASK